MVSVEKENAFQLRDYFHTKIVEKAGNDPFKSCFLSFLGLVQEQPPSFEFATLPLYQKCAITGLQVIDENVSALELSRLLGQASKIDSTPMPWVSDVFGVMAVKWLVDERDDNELESQFKSWVDDFLLQQVSSDRLNVYEKDIAAYITDSDEVTFVSACIPLFFHYREIQLIIDHQNRQSLIHKFMDEFKMQVKLDPSAALLSLMIYVFDKANQDVALVPPNGWRLGDLVGFLERIPNGLRRWTWEENRRTKNAEPIKWFIENEYHVQNLLYVLLAPIFEDIADEVYLQPLGQKTPRVDLYLPPMHTIIEVKYRKDNKKSFQALIGEIAEDISLYRADPTYKEARIICFLWDYTRSTQEHSKFREGVMKMEGIDGCVVINAPSVMDQR